MPKEDPEELFKGFKDGEEKEEKKKIKRYDIVESRTLEKGDQRREQVKEFIVRYKPVMLERIIFLSIIAVLLLYILYSSFSGCAFGSLFGERQVVVNGEDNESAVNNTTAIIKSETSKETPKETPKSSTKSSGGSITLTIDNIDFERGNNSYPVKMKTVSYTIDNQKADFIPILRVYWYDADSEVVIKSKIRASFSVGIPIRAGQKISGTIRSFDSYYFDKTRLQDETVKVELVDSSTTEIISIKSQTVK